VKSKKERVTFAVDMILEYQNDDGRRHLINSVLRDMRMDLGGVGDVIGHYSVKHVEGSARVVTDPGGTKNEE